MEIYVKTLTGTKYLFDIEPNDLIIKLKDKIQDKIRIPLNSQRLKKYFFDIEPNDLVEKLKDKIQDKIGIPPNSQRLLFAGVILKDENTISYYGMIDGSIVHMILFLRQN
ncbi:UBIQUITIN-40S ribosomal protein S27A [Anaeramoeba ignava]|uniref:UBIQUITIN-40S ribosomal protein S27A n=1 Tax=Anaeramoeba ignava TaxID=1746090 RepID=A0A9Q0R9N2_ANAIG|nr:UBIQUITIN-40S ribosomal protein S27A [Anaeramoeba ignava]